ncbi:hypothetical protein EJC49_19030 [Aquibium carbonis]|uniref:Uncharacterized protein n=1 Tax=Aquibium carbonis TaxID=2495581 RepID=A0A429YTJ4_9HYPH|nr:hypothetical protein [Aquibium carbonis]RST84786.1 hypothetical protein EJC49_19030 [Aquibium carbonis]
MLTFQTLSTVGDSAAAFCQLAEAELKGGSDAAKAVEDDQFTRLLREPPGEVSRKGQDADAIQQNVDSTYELAVRLRSVMLDVHRSRRNMIELLRQSIQRWHTFYVRHATDEERKARAEDAFLATFPGILLYAKILANVTDERLGEVLDVAGHSVARYIKGESAPRVSARAEFMFRLRDWLMLRERELDGLLDREQVHFTKDACMNVTSIQAHAATSGKSRAHSGKDSLPDLHKDAAQKRSQSSSGNSAARSH